MFPIAVAQPAASGGIPCMMVIEHATAATVDAESVTCTVKGKVLATAGVPVTLPLLSMDKPVGSDPVAIVKVYGGVPPLAGKVCV